MRAAESWQQKLRRELGVQLGESSRRKWEEPMENHHLPRKSPPLSSHRGQLRLQLSGEGSSLGSQPEEERKAGRCQRQQHRESRRGCRTCWRLPGSWSSSEHRPALLSPARRTERNSGKKSKERLPGSFYEVIITLITKPVKNSIYAKRNNSASILNVDRKFLRKPEQTGLKDIKKSTMVAK